MRIFAISDLHLSLKNGELQKPQDVFGEAWRDHHLKIERDWRSRVTEEDLVLLPGDLSWAAKPDLAREDLAWIDSLPGKKIVVKGNHDWWIPGSRAKMEALLPPTISVVGREVVLIQGILLFGTRMWTIPGLGFPAQPGDPKQDRRLLERELGRLKASIEKASVVSRENDVTHKICMTHFPPTDFSGRPTEATEMLTDFGTHLCVFGHVHGFDGAGNGVEIGGTRYFLTSCDYLDFRLLRLDEELH